MRLFIFILCLTTSHLMASHTMYASSEFILVLKEDSSFVFYPKEVSLKTNVAGNYLLRNDSLILKTHRFRNEAAIFAIYKFDDLKLELVHFQKEFALSLPSSFYIDRTLFPDRRVQEEYLWTDKNKVDYSVYSFSEDGYLLAIENFKSAQKDGPQYYYFDNPYSALRKELNYKDGTLHGKSYYFEAIDKKYLQVQLIKEETFKEGKLFKAKMPVTPPVFYTSHF